MGSWRGILVLTWLGQGTPGYFFIEDNVAAGTNFACLWIIEAVRFGRVIVANENTLGSLGVHFRPIDFGNVRPCFASKGPEMRDGWLLSGPGLLGSHTIKS